MTRGGVPVSVVAQINNETLLDFVGRVGVVNTDNVRMRFGWNYRQARRHMDELERKGLIRRLGLRADNEIGGARLEWRKA